jgi:Ca2+/Na+ antiporter
MNRAFLKSLIIGNPVTGARGKFVVMLVILRWLIGLPSLTTGLEGLLSGDKLYVLASFWLFLFGLFVVPATAILLEKITKIHKVIRMVVTPLFFTLFMLTISWNNIVHFFSSHMIAIIIFTAIFITAVIDFIHKAKNNVTFQEIKNRPRPHDLSEFDKIKS